MNEVYLIIAAPWQYNPSEGAVRSLVRVLPRCGLVQGTPVVESREQSDGRRGSTWTWRAGPAVAAELGFRHCDEVTLSVTEWLQPMIGLHDITCPQGHPLPAGVLDELYQTGNSPEYQCGACGARGSLLAIDQDTPHYTLMASRLWMRVDHAAGWVEDCAALAAVRRVLGVDRLEIGQFPIAW